MDLSVFLCLTGPPDDGGKEPAVSFWGRICSWGGRWRPVSGGSGGGGVSLSGAPSSLF